MKLATVNKNNKQLAGLVVNDEVYDLERIMKDAGVCVSGVKKLLSLGEQGLELCRQGKKRIQEDPELACNLSLGRVKELDFCPPIPDPNKILCVAGNYSEHIREGSGALFDKDRSNPYIFQKPVSTGLIGHNDPIRLPRVWDRVDWEAELAVVIGRKGKYIEKEQALDYVFGYTILNDVSGRGLKLVENREERERDAFFDWLHGKSMDTFAPVGPYLVHRDQVGDPQQLRIRLWVNGEKKQDSTTDNMIYTVAELISFISQIMTLEPGDIIATGTPSGVGSASGTFLQNGDEVKINIEKIGNLLNPVRDEVL